MTENVDGDMQESMVDRVKRVLDQAEQFRRHGEEGSADAALARAEAIMLKYSIDAATIAARQGNDGHDESQLVHETISFTGIYASALVVRFDQLLGAHMLSGRRFVEKQGSERLLHVIGFAADVSNAQVLAASILLQAHDAMWHWWLTYEERIALTSMQRFKARRQFMVSFVVGATDRLWLTRRTMLGEAATGTAIVLRSAQDVIDNFVNREFDLISRATHLKPGTRDAELAGLDAGLRANTGDTPVGPDRRALTSGNNRTTG